MKSSNKKNKLISPSKHTNVFRPEKKIPLGVEKGKKNSNQSSGPEVGVLTEFKTAVYCVPGVLRPGSIGTVVAVLPTRVFGAKLRVFARVWIDGAPLSPHHDVILDRMPQGPFFAGTFVIPASADSVEIVIHDGREHWVRNRGKNWSFAVEDRMEEDKKGRSFSDKRLAKYDELVRLMASENFRADLADALSTPFEVVVLATMKAGKSTLINALIGRELLPTDVEACTAIVYRLEDVDTDRNMRLRSVVNDHIGEWEPASAERLVEWNKDSLCTLVEIQGNLPFIKNAGARLVLHDTPGPNNARDPRHAETTHNLLRNGPYGMALYVIDVEQLGANDDHGLLRMLKDAFDQSEASGHSKEIVFVLNKMDRLDPDKHGTPEEFIGHLKDYLGEHGFRNPTVIPLVARTALLLRAALRGDRLTKKETREIQQHLEKYPSHRDRFLPFVTMDGDLGKEVDLLLVLRSLEEREGIDPIMLFDRLHPVQTIRDALHATGITALEAVIETTLIHQVFPQTLMRVKKALTEHNAPLLKDWIAAKAGGVLPSDSPAEDNSRRNINTHER